MIKFATVFGSQEGYDRVAALKVRLAKLLDECGAGGLTSSVDMYLITLFISGEVEDYQLEGCDRLRFQAKQKRLVVDVGIPEAAWRNRTDSEIARLIAQRVSEAYDLALTRFRKRGDSEPSARASECVRSAISQFVSEFD